MKLYLSILLVFTVLPLAAQRVNFENQQPGRALTVQEQRELSSLPELSLPGHCKTKTLPVEVDNSVLPYHIGLFEQAGYECGQAASVANAFTYEIDRLRGLDATLPENKYPTHFAWNWENGGYGWYGASYYHTMKLLKTVGTPDVPTYGGAYDSGGSSRFMTGYDNYYAAMHNRISGAVSVKCDTEDGILCLKNWLYDHLDGSETGGIGFFYSQYQSGSNNLPAGTPHEGEKVLISWGSSPDHAMCIIGYNDSVRWDYNNDGQYTNDIDITGDDIVDVRDWEIGAFKMVNNYSTPYYAWMMYRTLALGTEEGGIWNQTVNLMFPLREYSPVLTYKVNLNYSNRKRMKIMTGFSTDLSAEQPDYYLSFPIFDYQGGELPLQGSIGDEYKNLEFGLDVTPMLNLINSGTPVKFFFMVLENDNWGWGTGRIIDFSVIDYSTGSPVEITSPQTDVSIVNNGLTTVALTHTPVFEKPGINPEALPEPLIGQNYSEQLEVEGGTAPYRWEFNTGFRIEHSSQAAPEALTPLDEGYVELPFSFNFYGSEYQGFYLSNNGYIDFSGQPYDLPYNDNAASNLTVSFMHRRCIAAFMSATSCSAFSSAGDGYYAIQWIADGIDVTLKLESNGRFYVFYNDCTGLNSQAWLSGASGGDLEHFTMAPLSGQPGSIPAIATRFVPSRPPLELQLSDNGLLSGVITQSVQNNSFGIKVTDARGLTDVQNYSFFTGIDTETDLTTTDLLIYPNPANKLLSVKLPDTDGDVALAEIYDINGRMLRRWVAPITSLTAIDVSGLPTGNYCIRLWSGNQAFSGKFLKVK